VKTRERVVALDALVTAENVGGAKTAKRRVIAPKAHCGWHRQIWEWARKLPPAGTRGYLVYVSWMDDEGNLRRGTLEFREGIAPTSCQCVECRRAEVAA
jgi:hypothetical protein